MGLRKCHAPTYLLAYRLGMVREDVALVTATAGALTDDLRRVRARDCFMAISIHRHMTDTVRGAAWARSVGAHVIALIDNPGRPGRIGGRMFLRDAASTSVLRSMTAFTALMQTLTAEVAKSHGREARASLLQEEQLLSDFHIYTNGFGAQVRISLWTVTQPGTRTRHLAVYRLHMDTVLLAARKFATAASSDGRLRRSGVGRA
ncbi:MurR/RpiR family transcriptional regulator [Nocardia sp. NPDC004278]